MSKMSNKDIDVYRLRSFIRRNNDYRANPTNYYHDTYQLACNRVFMLIVSFICSVGLWLSPDFIGVDLSLTISVMIVATTFLLLLLTVAVGWSLVAVFSILISMIDSFADWIEGN